MSHVEAYSGRRDPINCPANQVKRKTRKKKAKWGAYCNGTLCCTGTEREMRNKVDNEERTRTLNTWRGMIWEARQL